MPRRYLERAIIGICALFLVGVLCADGQEQDTTTINEAKIGVSGGLGVAVVVATDMVDYMNLTFNPQPKIDDFTTAAEFFGAGDIRLSEDWNLKLEYAYLLKSYNVPGLFGPDFVISYSVHMPTAILQRVIEGKGYIVKFGGGIGYHFGHATTDLTPFVDNFSANGIGLKIDAEGDTQFDEHLYGYVGADIRDEILGELHDDTGKGLAIPGTGRNAKLGFISLSLKFGLTYFF